MKKNDFSVIQAAEQALEDSGIVEVGRELRIGLYMAVPSVPCKSQFEQIRKSMNAAMGNGSSFDPSFFSRALAAEARPLQNWTQLFPFRYLAEKYNIRGEFMNINVACATGTQLIQGALENLRRNGVDAVLAAAVNTNLDPYYLNSMEKLGALSRLNAEPQAACRPFDAERDGFVMSEGAAAMILEKQERAESRDTKIHARIGGVGVSADGYHPTAPEPSGRGMILSMKKALAAAGCEPGQIDYINAHGTGTSLNDRLETDAIKAVFGPRAYQLLISSTKSMTGHMFTAAGMFEALFGILSCRDNLIPPTINYRTRDPDCDLNYVVNETVNVRVDKVLSNSFGFGGQNACLVVGKY